MKIITKDPGVLSRGYLLNLATRVMSKEKLEAKQKLNTDQLVRIATTLGYLSKDRNLYDVLFGGKHCEMESDGYKVDTRDLAMFVLLDWQYNRGYFMRYTGGATTDTRMGRGVPLAFEGARRLYNKSYMSWTELPAKECDVFLPHGFNSLELDESGKFVQSKEKGLLRLLKSDVDFSIEVVRQLREFIPNWATYHKPRMITKNALEDTELVDYWNELSHLCRCMILQGWIFKHPSRHANMITDYRDWDKFAPSLDEGVTALKGHKPKKSPIPDQFLHLAGINSE